MLETTECIPIQTNNREFTDCMEFSLLRFLHFIFYSTTEIENHGSSKYIIFPDNPIIQIHPDLSIWIEEHPLIYKSSSYYHQKEGIKERNDWAHFISDRPYFNYYRTDSAELFTNLYNIIIFCKELLGMNIDLKDDESNNIQIIAKYIKDYSKKEIELYIDEEENTTTNMPIQTIKSLISKPQTDIQHLDKPSYSVISKHTVLYFSIDSHTYHWNLYEVYFTNKNIVSNHFITGHSVINTTTPCFTRNSKSSQRVT